MSNSTPEQNLETSRVAQNIERVIDSSADWGLQSQAGGALRGRVDLPGDKSVSHRSLIFAALAFGKSHIEGLLEAEDTQSTAAALRALGADIERQGVGCYRVTGTGYALTEPGDVLNMGNSGTSARLLLGVLAACPLFACLTGDISLKKRPMGRVVGPLSRMGAHFDGCYGMRLPLAVRGAQQVLPASEVMQVPSAQVKSAILLAGLKAKGETIVVEPIPTRDHTERMLRLFGISVDEMTTDDGTRICLRGGDLQGQSLQVPGDPSAAAFFAVAASIVDDSEITIPRMMMNPGRVGFLTALEMLGADVTCVPVAPASSSAAPSSGRPSGEDFADLTIRAAKLKGAHLSAGLAASMIDEIPILAMAAAVAKGMTRFEGIGELRVKESDRIAAVESNLLKVGVVCRSGPDWLEIEGCAGPVPGGGFVETFHDHRIVMSFAILGLKARKPILISSMKPVLTSFPGFQQAMLELGATCRIIEPA